MSNDIILLGHGSGGRLGHKLLDELIIPTLSGVTQRDQNDAAVLEGEGSAFSLAALGKRILTVQEVRAVKDAVFDVND